MIDDQWKPANFLKPGQASVVPSINIDAAVAAVRDAGRYEAALMLLVSDMRAWKPGAYRDADELRARLRDVLVAADLWNPDQP